MPNDNKNRLASIPQLDLLTVESKGVTKTDEIISKNFRLKIIIKKRNVIGYFVFLRIFSPIIFKPF